MQKAMPLRQWLKHWASLTRLIITTNYRIGETGPAVDEDITNKLYAGVSGFFSEEISREDFFTDETEEAIGLVGSRVVGPTIADDIKTGAVYSIIFSLIVVFLYILGRFRKWQFSLGAVAALLHDVLFVLGLFSILDGVLPFQLEVDQAFIAAILTVIGYSLNDTVVVFDRIRENMGSRKGELRCRGEQIVEPDIEPYVQYLFDNVLRTSRDLPIRW